jgi:hypothetical protein
MRAARITASPWASASSSGSVPNVRFPSTTSVFSPPRNELDLVSTRLGELDDAQPVTCDRPLRVAAADCDSAIGPPQLPLDRIGKGRQISFAVLDHQRAVLQPDEADALALGVWRIRRRDRVVLALARDAVDPGLRDRPGEERPGARLCDAAFLCEPLVERFRTAEQPQAQPCGSISP